MGIKLAKKNNQFNMQRRTFYIDSADDLEIIEAEYDCGIGDLAELPDGTTYCRHSDGYDGDLWEKRGSSKSGGGGGGSDSSVLVVHDVEGTLDKTWQEIYDAVMSNRVCFIGSSSDAENWGDLYLLVNIQWSEGSYAVSNGNATYYADSPNDYPVSD